MSLQNLAVVNTLRVLPFYDLHDMEFSFVIGNWTGQFDELITSDLYNLLPNPDKNDEADPHSTTISKTVQAEWFYCFRAFGNLMKPEARVFEMTSPKNE